MGWKKSQKLGIIQVASQTLHAKSQNARIGSQFIVCVNRYLDKSIWLNYEVVEFQASVRDFSSLRLCRLLLYNSTPPPRYTSTYRSYHTSSSAHLGVPRLRPIISSYHTRSFVHLGLSCIRPSIMNYHPTNPPPSGFYCTMLSSNILLLLAAHKITAKVAQSFFSVASWHH